MGAGARPDLPLTPKCAQFDKRDGYQRAAEGNDALTRLYLAVSSGHFIAAFLPSPARSWNAPFAAHHVANNYFARVPPNESNGAL